MVSAAELNLSERAIATVGGPFVGEEGVLCLEAQLLQMFRPETTRFMNDFVTQELKGKAYGRFPISEGAMGYLLEKTRPYSRMYDLMLVLVGTEDRYIRSINDLTPYELRRTLTIGEDVLEIYKEHSGKPLLTTISFNFHDDPLSQRELATSRQMLADVTHDSSLLSAEIKTDAQFFPFAHPHITAIELDTITPVPLTDASITPREALNVFDPTMLLVREAFDIPSIHRELTADLACLLNLECRPTGVHFKTTEKHLDSIQLAKELQLLQGRFEKLYTEFAHLFINTNEVDDVHMPALAFDREQRIDNYLNRLFTIKENDGQTTQLNRLKRHLHLLSTHLVPADDPAVLRGEKPMFMRGFADTITLSKTTNDEYWEGDIAVRALSTGNMLASKGLVRQKPESGQPPTDEWLHERADMLSRVITYAEGYGNERHHLPGKVKIGNRSGY